MSVSISTTIDIDIDAGPQAVWEVLTDFVAYGDARAATTGFRMDRRAELVAAARHPLETEGWT